MGLELGPPWLVAVIDDGYGFNTIYRDNFTGAGFERVRRVVSDEPGAISAVVGRNGRLARHPNGDIFQPIAEMRSRSYGTPAERGHRAYLLGCRLLGEAPHPLLANGGKFGSSIQWLLLALTALVILGLLVEGF